MVGLALLLAACTSDLFVQPTTAASCRVGILSPFESVAGEFSDGSCVLPYHFWSSEATPTATYQVALEAGKGYWFYMQQSPDETGRNEVDALLTLWGRDAQGAAIPLALSDDDAGGINDRDAEFYFVAPRSGLFDLLASSYRADALGGYRLTMAECPVVAVLDTAGRYEGIPMTPSECVRHGIAGSDVSTRIVLVAVNAHPFESVIMDVASEDLTPAVEIGGPDFDVFASIYSDSRFDAALAAPASVQVVTRELGGMLTLAVGADALDATGTFSVDLDRQSQENVMGAPLGSVPRLRAAPLHGRKR